MPINSSQQHGIGIGAHGREGTVENALSQGKRFGLTQAKAKKFIATVQELTHEWQSYFAKAGVSNGDIERLKGVIPAVNPKIIS